MVQHIEILFDCNNMNKFTMWSVMWLKLRLLDLIPSGVINKSDLKNKINLQFCQGIKH